MRKLRKPKPIILSTTPAHIHALSNEGVGIASVSGKTTFIEGGLPQETVHYRTFKQGRQYDQAACTEIVTPSPMRTTPSCDQFGVCGGCSLQHLEMNSQIEWKEKILLEQLQHLGNLKPENILPPLSAASWGYRHKARIGARFLDKESKVSVGFRKKFRHHIADSNLCHILHPSIGTRLDRLRELINSLSCKKDLPQMEVAVGDTEAALIFRHLVPLTSDDREKLLQFGKDTNIHVYLQPNPPENISLLWPENGKERLSYHLPDFNLEILFHPTDFTQIHLELNRLMVKQALHLLDPQSNENILDLFCGLGNFSLPLARFAKKVTGVEGSAIMVERGYENAKHNNIENIEFHAANLFDIPLAADWYNQTFEKILIDPPRTGAKEIIADIPRFKAQRIVYVSCNPATLARDAGILVHEHHYRLTHAGMMNMFPHTNHIEAIAVFDLR